jgi:NTP pyrophosphatase (non-canonical NTP hydrolase)
MNGPLNKLRDKVVEYAVRQGFHNGNHRTVNLGERLMLIVSELSEALEADRNGKWSRDVDEIVHDKTTWLDVTNVPMEIISKKGYYEKYVKGTVEEEIADTFIRICDLAGIYGIDLDFHVAAKMAYNELRPYRHGKKYG